MSKKPRRTGVFPPHIKPVHVGEYEATSWKASSTTCLRRWWNGEWWSRCYRDFDSEVHKEVHRRLKAPLNQNFYWRGLTKKPE